MSRVRNSSIDNLPQMPFAKPKPYNKLTDNELTNIQELQFN